MSESQQPVTAHGIMPPMRPRNPLRDLGDILIGRKREVPMVQEGDIIQLKNNDPVYTDLPKALLYGNCPCDWTLAHGETIIGRYAPEGRYIVTKTAMEGGGTGHGPHDVYPDGHHVFCQHADHPHIKVDFYQSGCFGCVIQKPEVVGKAKLAWTAVSE